LGAEIRAAVEMRMEKDLDGLAGFAAFANGALELQGVDLEVLAPGSWVALRVDRVVLVRQVLELDGSIGKQGIAGRTIEEAASLLVALVRRAGGAFDLEQRRPCDADVASDPGRFGRVHVTPHQMYFFSH